MASSDEANPFAFIPALAAPGWIVAFYRGRAFGVLPPADYNIPPGPQATWSKPMQEKFLLEPDRGFGILPPTDYNIPPPPPKPQVQPKATKDGQTTLSSDEHSKLPKKLFAAYATLLSSDNKVLRPYDKLIRHNYLTKVLKAAVHLHARVERMKRDGLDQRPQWVRIGSGGFQKWSWGFRVFHQSVRKESSSENSYSTGPPINAWFGKAISHIDDNIERIERVSLEGISGILVKNTKEEADYTGFEWNHYLGKPLRSALELREVLQADGAAHDVFWDMPIYWGLSKAVEDAEETQDNQDVSWVEDDGNGEEGSDTSTWKTFSPSMSEVLHIDEDGYRRIH
ncbi:MAG: hypothetical protein Q9212_003810 [Teloschistes hypoglaucus]